MNGRVVPPRADEIFADPGPTPHPLDVLLSPDIDAAVREGYQQACMWRDLYRAAVRLASDLQRGLTRACDERDALRDELRRVRREAA